jgi:hypothetical protein
MNWQDSPIEIATKEQMRPKWLGIDQHERYLIHWYRRAGQVEGYWIGPTFFDKEKHRLYLERRAAAE